MKGIQVFKSAICAGGAGCVLGAAMIFYRYAYCELLNRLGSAATPPELTRWCDQLTPHTVLSGVIGLLFFMVGYGWVCSRAMPTESECWWHLLRGFIAIAGLSVLVPLFQLMVGIDEHLAVESHPLFVLMDLPWMLLCASPLILHFAILRRHRDA